MKEKEHQVYMNNDVITSGIAVAEETPPRGHVATGGELNAACERGSDLALAPSKLNSNSHFNQDMVKDDLENSLLGLKRFKHYGIQESDKEVNYIKRPKACFGSRHVFAIMGFFGLASVYAMRVNLSVAIVDMVSSGAHRRYRSTISSFSANDSNVTEEFCPSNGESGTDHEGEFEWDGETQGLILGCFFWGYMATQIPGGILAEKYGGKLLFGCGTLVTALFTLLAPVAARTHLVFFIVVRVLTGLGEGVTLPAMHVMLSTWVPPSERSTIGAFVSAGMQFGTVISLPLSGFLAEIEYDNGWPLVFYVPGAFGIVWFIVWVFLIYDDPSVHPRIAEDEKQYILASTGGKMHKKSVSDVPWLTILTSIHLWAILVAHTGQGWGFYMLLTELPTYMKTVLHFDMKSNSLLSALPYLAMWILSNVASVTADTLIRKKTFTITQVRKIFNSIGFFIPAGALIGAAFTDCDRIATVVLLTIASGTNGAIYSGFQVNHMDVASNYAGIMMGITNCVANICGFLAPYVVGVIVTAEGSIYQWRLVFFISAAVYVVSNIFYVVFGTAEEQPWNKSRKPKEDDY